MNIQISRKHRTRKEKFRKKRNQLFLLVNIFLFYLMLLSLSDITSSTYSYFSDELVYSGSIKNSEDFCKDKEYKEKYCKDNSGRGNGSEPVDEQDDEFGDEDNKGHPEDCRKEDKSKCDDHPKSGNGNSNGDKSSVISTESDEKVEGSEEPYPESDQNVTGETNVQSEEEVQSPPISEETVEVKSSIEETTENIPPSTSQEEETTENKKSEDEEKQVP
jgi:hypothetical protein